MPTFSFTLTFIAFAAIWSVWSIWTAVQPILSIHQMAMLFPLLPISAVLVAFSFIQNKDDDDGEGGNFQPILQKVRS